MMDPNTWNDVAEPDIPLPGPFGWLRALFRAVPLIVLVFGCLLLLLAVRLIEAPLYGARRPLTPWITVFVCRNALRLLGIGYETRGTPMTQAGAMVANHSSWLDIFVLNAAAPLYFVSKAEVASWPGIGWLAKATGTVFIERDRRQARAHTKMLENRLLSGHKLLFFPEGTSTDGRVVLPFKSTLFAPFYTDSLRQHISVQPVSVIYHAPEGADVRFYGWWGDMSFGAHLLHTLAGRRQGHVEVVYHDPIPEADAPDRKAMAVRAEKIVRAGHARALGFPLLDTR